MNCARKRTYSNSTSTASQNNNHRKRRKYYKRGFIPPTKFLLGGNIYDPLNLGGLTCDEGRDGDKMYPSLKDFLLGGNVHDPLNLKGVQLEKCEESICNAESNNAGEESLDGMYESTTDACTFESFQDLHVDISKSHLELFISDKLNDKRDKIVSPVIPQPYRPLKVYKRHKIITPVIAAEGKTPKFRDKNTKFQYGNFEHLPGECGWGGSCDGDYRVEIFARHKHLFAGKTILDVGCNVGHIALMVAQCLGPRIVTGLDIDGRLIEKAQRNATYFVKCPSPFIKKSPAQSANLETLKLRNMKDQLRRKCFPLSMPMLYGAIADTDMPSFTFPKNVNFIQGNYVLETENQLAMEKCQYDTILCLNVTKWIHLNWGDKGLKMTFRRIFAQLNPGGVLLLEAQSWDSYKKHKSLTEEIWRNYKSIKFFPHHFDSFLTRNVGFCRSQTLDVVHHQKKGFSRRIKAFFKKDVSKCEFVPDLSTKESAK